MLVYQRVPKGKIIELDDGKILTGKPDQFDGKNPWVSGEDFPLNQSIDKTNRRLFFFFYTLW